MIKAEDIENNQEDISCACEDIQLPGPLPDKSFYTKYKSQSLVRVFTNLKKRCNNG